MIKIIRGYESGGINGCPRNWKACLLGLAMAGCFAPSYKAVGRSSPDSQHMQAPECELKQRLQLGGSILASQVEEEPALYILPSLEYFLHSKHVTLEPFSSKCGSEGTWVREVGYRGNSEKSG